MFIFWDLYLDEPKFLTDEGEFISFGQDEIEIKRNGFDSGTYWMTTCKVSEVHPLNTPDRYVIFCPRDDLWTSLHACHIKTYKEVMKLAGAICE